MIKQYQGSGITTYTLRSGTEITLSEEDFEEMLGFKDEMDKIRVRCVELSSAYQESCAIIVGLKAKAKKLKKKLKGKLL